MKIKLALALIVLLTVQVVIGQEKIEKKEILYTNTQDWPNLERFKEENEKLKPPAEEKVKKS